MDSCLVRGGQGFPYQKPMGLVLSSYYQVIGNLAPGACCNLIGFLGIIASACTDIPRWASFDFLSPACPCQGLIFGNYRLVGRFCIQTKLIIKSRVGFLSSVVMHWHYSEKKSTYLVCVSACVCRCVSSLYVSIYLICKISFLLLASSIFLLLCIFLEVGKGSSFRVPGRIPWCSACQFFASPFNCSLQ